MGEAGLLSQNDKQTTRIDVGRQEQLSRLFYQHIAILYIIVTSRERECCLLVLNSVTSTSSLSRVAGKGGSESRAATPLAAEEEEEEGLKQRATWTLSATARRRRGGGERSASGPGRVAFYHMQDTVSRSRLLIRTSVTGFPDPELCKFFRLSLQTLVLLLSRPAYASEYYTPLSVCTP